MGDGGSPAALVQNFRPERKLGRFLLLNWLNDTLQADYARVEDCADGVAYMQLVESVLPGRQTAPLHKLNFSTQFVDDRLRNLRVLSGFFKRVGIEKDIDFDNVARGKFQENIDFLHWCFSFVQKNAHLAPGPYNALERRMEAIGRQQAAATGSIRVSKSKSPAKPTMSNNLLPNVVTLASTFHNPSGSRTGGGGGTGGEGRTARQAELDNLTEFLQSELEPRLAAHLALREQVAVAARERTRYFHKLKQVEEACRGGGADLAMSRQILQVIEAPPPPIEELLLELI